MDQDTTDSIQTRAYNIWEAAGKPEGEHESHWHQALQELGLASPAEQPAGTTLAGQSDAQRQQARNINDRPA